MFLASQHHIEMIQGEFYDFMRALQIGERDLAALLEIPDYALAAVLEGFSYPNEETLKLFWELKSEYGLSKGA